ncbi:oligosaccharide flippase family protein [Allorhizobium taibaishanense]|uniref:O-antigen/teichoic acid export membrane protein n=1 Tax=Allorhizobium taibaishanense TaxID=887144 RepID=A0A1Q9ABI9_9HYPH|nr:polysaccharide biosynthesis C-terminal domain-containing protein [Allorhizobium taibaishanense]MBB4010657.1 O-antigen/teichoic acid export membrane protein [Allorhizobium taibaishanense]OLP52249.1 sugar transporter [Allorhizobium taibaishanense]
MSNGIVANSAFNAAAGLTLLATGFLCSIFTARMLGPEANGIIAFSIWLASTAALVAELGTGVLLLRLLPQLKGQGFDERDRKGFAAYLLWPVIGSTALFLTFYFLFFWVAEAKHWAETAPTVLVVTAMLFATQAIGMFAKNYLIGEQRVDIFFRMTLTAGLLQLIGVVAGTLLFGVPGALFGYVLAYISQFMFAVALLRHKVKTCGIGFRYLVNSSFLLSLEFMIDSIFLNRIELFFLQRYHGIETVGYYAVAFSLTNLALQVPIQLSGSLVPYYAEHLHRAPGKRLPVEMFESVVRSLAYFTLPMSLGLAVISHRLVTLVFGDAFAPSASMLTLLALSVPVAVACQVATQYLFAIDKIRERLFVGLGGALIMLAGDVLLVPAYGGEGAAFVRIIVFTAMSLAMLRWMRFEGSLAPLGRSLLKVLLASGCCALAALAVQEVVPGIPGLALAIVGAAGVYGLALRVLRAVPKADVKVMEGFIARLPSWLAAPLDAVLLMLTGIPKEAD